MTPLLAGWGRDGAKALHGSIALGGGWKVPSMVCRMPLPRVNVGSLIMWYTPGPQIQGLPYPHFGAHAL